MKMRPIVATAPVRAARLVTGPLAVKVQRACPPGVSNLLAPTEATPVLMPMLASTSG